MSVRDDNKQEAIIVILKKSYSSRYGAGSGSRGSPTASSKFHTAKKKKGEEFLRVDRSLSAAAAAVSEQRSRELDEISSRLALSFSSSGID